MLRLFIRSLSPRSIVFLSLTGWLCAFSMFASAQTNRSVGPGTVIVHSMFGGQIFGFDIDQNGTEGVLSEAVTQADGTVLAAVETFDQATGAILNVVSETMTKDDFVTLGIVGKSIGLVEQEHVKNLFVSSRLYHTMNPLSANKFTGRWRPPLETDDLITSVSRNQDGPNTAFLGFQNHDAFNTFVFSSNVGANVNGSLVFLTDPTFFFSNLPQMAYDSTRNRAVVAASDAAVGGPPPVIAIVNLTTGAVTEFTGIHGPPPFRQGSINGIALDAEDSIAVTTTEIDFSVEFYNVKMKNGFSLVLPGATGQLQSGSDVEYDPINKLFLVAQPFSSTGTGSSIQVYDPLGNLVESLNGFSFSNAFNVIPIHIAINPTNRTGYVDGPDAGVSEIQSFTY